MHSFRLRHPAARNQRHFDRLRSLLPPCFRHAISCVARYRTGASLANQIALIAVLGDWRPDDAGRIATLRDRLLAVDGPGGWLQLGLVDGPLDDLPRLTVDDAVLLVVADFVGRGDADKCRNY